MLPQLYRAHHRLQQVCAGSGAAINLTGLLAGSTSTINYTINGAAQTPVTGVVADGSSAASFASAAPTPPMIIRVWK